MLRRLLNFVRQNLWLLTGMLALSLVGGYLGARIYTSSDHGSIRYVSSESDLISNVAKKVGPGVVSVTVETSQNVTDIFGNQFPQRSIGAGTGFIVRDDGVIVTNRHVVPEGTSQVTVTLADGTIYKNVEVLGRTAASSPLDLAFIKIKDLKGKKLTVVKLGDSDKVQVGDKVIAIGNALGQFENTVTEGIISGYGRQITAGDQSGAGSEDLSDLFQTDAAINPGNSGGPLVTLNGEAIGINTAVAGGAQNIGFAIPVNDFAGLVKSVLNSGKLQQAYLGVHYVNLTPDIANRYNLKSSQGAYVAPTGAADQSPVVSGSPAEKAGLQEKDIITKVNDIELNDRVNLSGALSRFQPGETVTLTVNRDGQILQLKATLAEAPKN